MTVPGIQCEMRSLSPAARLGLHKKMTKTFEVLSRGIKLLGRVPN